MDTSHNGIVGNEESDKAAKQRIYDGVSHNCEPLYTDIIIKLKKIHSVIVKTSIRSYSFK